MTDDQEYKINMLKHQLAIQSEIIHTLERHIKILQIKVGEKNAQIDQLRPYSEIIPQ